jgi:hypothetical protein
MVQRKMQHKANRKGKTPFPGASGNGDATSNYAARGRKALQSVLRSARVLLKPA